MEKENAKQALATCESNLNRENNKQMHYKINELNY